MLTVAKTTPAMKMTTLVAQALVLAALLMVAASAVPAALVAKVLPEGMVAVALVAVWEVGAATTAVLVALANRAPHVV